MGETETSPADTSRLLERDLSFSSPPISADSSEELTGKLTERLHKMGETPSPPATKRPPVPATRPKPATPKQQPSPPAAGSSPAKPKAAPSQEAKAKTRAPPDRAAALCLFYVLPLSLLFVAYVAATTRSAYLFLVRLPTLTDDELFTPPAAPVATAFKPTGLRLAASAHSAHVAVPRVTRMHRESVGRDGHSMAVVAPAFELTGAWEAEMTMRGGVLDDTGGLLFAPQSGNASLVAIDAVTGARRWALGLLDGEEPGGGVPMLLAAEDGKGMVVFHATRHRAYALRASDGSKVWGPIPTGLGEGRGGMEGFTFHASTDSVVGLARDGSLFALARATGARVAETKRLPCVPPRSRPDSGECVLHAMAASPSGRFFVVATARDDQDENVDGLADRAALYVFDLVQGEADSSLPLRLRVTSQLVMGDGVADVGAPAVTPDGKLLLLGDRFGHLTAFDTESLAAAWSVDGLGKGLVRVAAAGDEDGLAVYATTDSSVVKVAAREDGKAPVVVWRRESLFDAFDSRVVALAATVPSVVSNGVVLGVRLVTTPRAFVSDTVVRGGVALLDRATGATRWFAFAAEAVAGEVLVGDAGALFALHDPLARSGNELGRPPLPGLSRFAARVDGSAVREALCMAVDRIDNALATTQGGWLSSPPPGAEAAVRDDYAHVGAMVAGWSPVALGDRRAALATQQAQLRGARDALSAACKA